MRINDDTWERSEDFARPWRISDDDFESGYGRTSKGVVDANGQVVLFFDPSNDEYVVACTLAAAEEIIRAANK